jgi:hypothetical protein
VIPLTFLGDHKIANQVLFSLASIQASIKGSEIPPRNCYEKFADFIPVAQCFEIIIRLLTLFKERSIVFHQVESARTIITLLREKGFDEFHFDSIIVSLIVSVIQTDIDPEVIDLLIESIVFLSKLRPYAILTAISQTRFEKNFDKVFLGILDGQETVLLSHLSELFVRKEQTWFTTQGIRLTSHAIEVADDATFAKLFMAVFVDCGSISLPVFDIFFKSHPTIADCVRQIGERRPSCFKSLLANLTGNSSPALSRFALCCASESPQHSREFLQFAYLSLAVENADELSKVFQTVADLGELSDNLIEFLFGNLGNSHVIDCLVAAAVKLPGCQKLWDGFARLARSNILKTCEILERILERTTVDESHFTIALPVFLCNQADPVVGRVYGRLWSGAGGEELLRQLEGEVRKGCLEDFTGRMRNRTNIGQSAKFVTFLCDDVNEETNELIELLIDVLPGLDDPELVAKSLQRLLV